MYLMLGKLFTNPPHIRERSLTLYVFNAGQAINQLTPYTGGECYPFPACGGGWEGGDISVMHFLVAPTPPAHGLHSPADWPHCPKRAA